MAEEILDSRKQFFDLLKTEDTMGYVEFSFHRGDDEPDRGMCKIARPKKKDVSVPYLNFTFMVDFSRPEQEDALRSSFTLLRKKLKEEIPQDIDVIEAPVASDSPGMFMSEMDVLFNQGLSIDAYHIERFFLPAFARILPIQFETVTWVEEVV